MTLAHATNVIEPDFFARLRDRKNPYKTDKAEAARADARKRLPLEYIHRAISVIGDSAPNHNILTLAHALAYADAGLHVIDAHALDRAGVGTGPGKQIKLPRGARWQDRATTDPSEIEKFWSGDGEYPEDEHGEAYRYARPNVFRNVSAAFPKDCGLFVLDIDGDAGLDALEALEQEYGELPRTWESITGSGGVHLIFRAPDLDIRNTASSIAPGVDIRGANGQIIVPPSVHPSGNFYRWDAGSAPWECPVADAPDWLCKLAYEATKGRSEQKTKAKKASKKTKNGERASARTNQSSNDARGLDEHLALIGDGDGQKGFNAPIYSSFCSYFGTHGADAPIENILDKVKDAISNAERDPERDRSKYDDENYLLEQAEKAREYISEQGQQVDRKQSHGIGWPFYVEGGVIFRENDEGGDKAICQEFKIIGRSSNLAGDDNAGRIIEFVNENGVTVEMTLDRADLFKSDGGGAIDRLASAGMDLHFTGKSGRASMLELLQSIKSDRQVPIAQRGGWVRDRGGRVTGFLCPTGQFIPVASASPLTRLHSTAMVRDRMPRGTLEGWRDGIRQAEQNFFWVFGVCGGFVGPILDLVDGESCGICLSGDSSKGKTIALLMGSTVWASPANRRGLLYVMNSTVNAVEDIACIGSGTFCGLDEIGAMQNPSSLAGTLFGLSSSTGKNRKAGRHAGLAEGAEFCTFFMLTHERSLKSTVQDAGGDYKTGLSVRFPDVSVTKNKEVDQRTLDCIETLLDNFGHAGPAFVEELIEARWHERPEELKKRISETASKIAGLGATPALKRAAQVFALVQVAGELACEFEIIDLPVAQSVQKAFDAFRNSDEGRATAGADALLDQFRGYIARNLGNTIIEADCANLQVNRQVRGWFTDDLLIMDAHCLADMKGMGLNGKYDGLLAALNKIDAVVKSGKNNVHNALPVEVKLDDTARKDRQAKNVRIRRDKLGI